MTTANDFLRAIIEEPADDVHRLVYADWLEEQNRLGDAERAEFIRTQCELRRRDGDGSTRRECSWGGSCCCPSHKLLRRLRGVINKPGLPRAALGDALRVLSRPDDYSWSGTEEDMLIAFYRPQQQGVEVPPVAWEFGVRRGFVAEVHCPCAAWQRHGPDLVRSHPVEVVRLVDVTAAASFAHPGCYESNHVGDWPWKRRRYGAVADFSGFVADTRDEVRALVGRAALAWAREEAKLPPLRTP